MDTGAQCNILPLGTYKEATSDRVLKNIISTNTVVTAYGGATLPIVRRVLLRVWRGRTKYYLECKLVDSPKIRPLLGCKACLDMRIIKYQDNDAINKPVIGNAPVFALEPPIPMFLEQLEEKYPQVFGPGVGQLAGKYHIVLDEQVQPVQHPP